MAELNLECQCGYNADNEQQLNIHNQTCSNIVNQNSNNIDTSNNVEVDKTFSCRYCNKTLSTKFNCDRHMKKCKKIVNVNLDNLQNNNELIEHAEKCFKEMEADLLLLKGFITIYKSYNTNERQSFQSNIFYKTCIELIKRYQSFNNINNNTSIIPIPTAPVTNEDNNIIDNRNTNDINNNNNQLAINSNNNNTTNNVTNNFNNTTNNNITVIYPFGFENIYFLTDYQMVDILTSRNCLIEAINKIYSHVENKNFMKRNMKREQMTIIDESLDIKVMNDNVFKRKVIGNIFESLKRMFYHCKDKLKIEHQIMLWQNLRILDETIRDNMLMKREENMCAEIQSTMDTIMNIIAADNERPESRDCFLEIKNSMSNQAYKRLFNDKLNVIVQKIKEFSQDYKNREINLDFLRTNIWTSNLDTDQLLSLENPRNNILRNELELTPRYAFFRDMEIRENEYLGRDGHNTTGNIDNVCNIREKVAEDEFNKYNDKFDMEPKERKTLERKIKNEPKYKARDKMPTSRKTIMKNINANTHPHSNIPSITN